MAISHPDLQVFYPIIEPNSKQAGKGRETDAR